MGDKLDISEYHGNEVKIIQNVRAYIDENNVVHINAEDAARGLGFTQDKDNVGYVRWDRVNTYLAEFGFSPQVGKDDFIPEEMFYRLAMKANNGTAVVFQNSARLFIRK
jgi:prophage antirepressor-like protein